MISKTRKRQQEERISKMIVRIVRAKEWLAYKGLRGTKEDRLLTDRQAILFDLSRRIDGDIVR